MTKTILLFFECSKNLWAEAWIHAGYVKRHLPTTANEGFKSRIHMITGERAKLGHILPFGSLLYIAKDKH